MHDFVMQGLDMRIIHLLDTQVELALTDSSNLQNSRRVCSGEIGHYC